MEEKQIRDFVHRVSQDESLRNAFTQDPDSVIMREGFSPRVAEVIAKLVPHLSADSLERKQLRQWWS